MKNLLLTSLFVFGAFAPHAQANPQHYITVKIILFGATLADAGRVIEENLMDQAKEICGSLEQMQSLQNLQIQMSLNNVTETREDSALGERLLFNNYPQFTGSGEVVCK